MTSFWLLAAGLLLLTALFISAPLWWRFIRRQLPLSPAAPDQINVALFHQRCAELNDDVRTGVLDSAQQAAARCDLERELLHDVSAASSASPAAEPAARRLVVALTAVAVPALAVLLYLAIGQPQLAQSPVAAADAGQMPPLDVLAARLTERLQQTPENVDGWLMLGQTQFALSKPAEALAALQHAYDLAPERADVLLAYAEALAANNQNSFAGQPAELIAQVLAREPNNVSALWLRGMWAFQRQQFAAAIADWQRVLAHIDPASDDARALQQLLTEARQQLAAADSSAPATPAPADAATSPAATATP